MSEMGNWVIVGMIAVSAVIWLFNFDLWLRTKTDCVKIEVPKRLLDPRIDIANIRIEGLDARMKIHQKEIDRRLAYLEKRELLRH